MVTARSGLRKIVSNMLSVLTSTVVNRGTTFVLYALVARHLGAYEFGQMSLALTFFYLSQVFSVAGLKTFVMRAVANDRAQTEKYLIGGSLVVSVYSISSIFIVFIMVRLMGYQADTAAIILLLSLGLVPFALSAVCEAVFQGWEKMQYMAYANLPVNIAKVSLAPLGLARGYGLYHLIILLLCSYVALAIIEWWLILRHISRPLPRIDPAFTLAMARSAGTFLGIDVIIAVEASANILLLSKLIGERDVGLYSAALQLLVPIGLVQDSVALAMFPAMCRKFSSSLFGLRQISERLIELLFALALPAAVGLFFLADSILLFLYQDRQFLQASDVLRILVWGVLMRPLITVLGQILIASHREAITLRIVAIDTFISVVLGLIFIGHFGLIGAAVSAMIVAAVDIVMHYVPVARQLSDVPLGRLTWKPAVASAGMAIFLKMVPNYGLFPTIVSGGIIYVCLLLALLVWSNGGPGQFKARYACLWAE